MTKVRISYQQTGGLDPFQFNQVANKSTVNAQQALLDKCDGPGPF